MVCILTDGASKVTYDRGTGIVADLTERSVGSLIRDDILSGVKSVSSGPSASGAMEQAFARGFVGGPSWEYCRRTVRSTPLKYLIMRLGPNTGLLQGSTHINGLHLQFMSGIFIHNNHSARVELQTRKRA